MEELLLALLDQHSGVVREALELEQTVNSLGWGDVAGANQRAEKGARTRMKNFRHTLAELVAVFAPGDADRLHQLVVNFTPKT